MAMSGDAKAAAVIGTVAIVGGIGYYLYTKMTTTTTSTTTAVAEIKLSASSYNLSVNEPDTLTAVATDINGNPVAGSNIKFYADGQYLGEDTTDSTGTATFSTQFHSTGTYQAYAED